MLGDAKEEIRKSDELWGDSNVTALREQQKKDFGLWGPYEFKMPESEGKWDNVTTNSPKILANKILGLLEASWLQLYIDVDDEMRKERETISNTERLANGAIWIADRAAISVPSGKKLQTALSTYAVIKGGTVKSVYWYTNEEKKPVCDIKSYDPEYCQWLEGDQEILWFCYRNYVSKRYVDKKFKKEIGEGFQYGKPDSSGKILMYTFWDDDEWKVAINGEYIEGVGEVHKLGYIPVNIRSCGPAPYMQSEGYDNTMKWSWQSYAHNTRDVYDLESRMYTIENSKAIESGRIKIAGDWDSTLSDNQPPEGLKKLGYGSKTRNEIILFDSAKGQKFGGMIEPPSNEIVDRFLSRIEQRMDIMATIDPIAGGTLTRSGVSGTLAAQLTENALEFMNPFRECVEEDFIWIAEEVVRQFKNGTYNKVSLEGRDRKKEKFYIDLEPKDVEEKHFDCELVADRLRDEIQELSAAVEKVQNRLSSRRTVMVKHNIVEDPDREMDAMEEEEASLDPVFRYDKMAKYFKDQGDDRMALYYESLSALTIENTVKQAVMQQLMPPAAPGQNPPGVEATEPQNTF